MEHFHVTLTDEQLQAAKVSAAARGVSLGPVGSMSRDGVTITFTIESDGAGSNDVSVDVLYRPFYVPAETVQTLITEFLTNPPAVPEPEQAPEPEPAPKATPAGAAATAPKPGRGPELHRPLHNKE